jgi:hypothetical protein
MSALEPLSTSLAFASAALVMVVAGLSKNHLVWERRRRWFLRRRR